MVARLFKKLPLLPLAVQKTKLLERREHKNVLPLLLLWIMSAISKKLLEDFSFPWKKQWICTTNFHSPQSGWWIFVGQSYTATLERAHSSCFSLLWGYVTTLPTTCKITLIHNVPGFNFSNTQSCFLHQHIYIFSKLTYLWYYILHSHSFRNTLSQVLLCWHSKSEQLKWCLIQIMQFMY